MKPLILATTLFLSLFAFRIPSAYAQRNCFAGAPPPDSCTDYEILGNQELNEALIRGLKTHLGQVIPTIDYRKDYIDFENSLFDVLNSPSETAQAKLLAKKQLELLRDNIAQLKRDKSRITRRLAQIDFNAIDQLAMIETIQPTLVSQLQYLDFGKQLISAIAQPSTSDHQVWLACLQLADLLYSIQLTGFVRDELNREMVRVDREKLNQGILRAQKEQLKYARGQHATGVAP